MRSASSLAVIALVALACFTACPDGTGPSTTTTTPTTAPTTATTTVPTTTAPTTAPTTSAPTTAPTTTISYTLTANPGPEVTQYALRSAFFDGSRSVASLGFQNFSWNFGDGVTQSGATLSQVSHVYTCETKPAGVNAADFTVTLTVTDTQGHTASAKTVAHINYVYISPICR